MRTLLPDPAPAPFDELLERRRRWGADRRDEVWKGVLHMSPPASHEHERLVMKLGYLLTPYAEKRGLELTGAVGIGTEDDYRVPDLALHHPGAAEQWHPSAALAVEIVSPGDESWDKLPFYAVHQVEELLIVDPAKRAVDWLALEEEGYRAVPAQPLGGARGGRARRGDRLAVATASTTRTARREDRASGADSNATAWPAPRDPEEVERYFRHYLSDNGRKLYAAAARIEQHRGPGYTLSDIAANLSLEYGSALSIHRTSGRSARRWKAETGTEAPIQLVWIGYDWVDEEQGMRTRYQLPPGVTEVIARLS